MWIPDEDMHSQWGCAFPVSYIPIPVRMGISGESHTHSWWGCAFVVRHIPIFSEDAYSIVIHPHRECTSSLRMGMCVTRNAHPHRDSGYASLEMHMLTGIADMPHQEWRCYLSRMHIPPGIGYVTHRQCTSSPGLRICLTGNAHPHRDFRYASSGFQICLTRNAHPHWDCRYPLQGMHLLTGMTDMPHWESTSSLGWQICLTGNAHPHWDCRCPSLECTSSLGCGYTSLGMHVLTKIVDIPHQECTSSSGLQICLTRNAYPHWDCRCPLLGMGLWIYLTGNAHPLLDCGYTSPGKHILTGIADMPHWKCTSSPGLQMCLTRNAHPHRDCGYASLGMGMWLTGNALSLYRVLLWTEKTLIVYSGHF